MLKEKGYKDSYELFSKSVPNPRLAKLDSKEYYSNNKIRVAIDSQDAEILEYELYQKSEIIDKTRAQEYAKINAKEEFFGWSSFMLYDVIEDDKYISFITYDESFYVPGEFSQNLESYTFDKRTGKRMELKSVLEAENISYSEIEELLQKDIDSGKFQEAWAESKDSKLVIESNPDLAIERTEKSGGSESIIKINDENGIIITKDKIYLIIDFFGIYGNGYMNFGVYELER